MSAVAVTKGTSDRKLLLILGGVMVVLFLGLGLMARGAHERDMQPTTYNTDSGGAKGAFLTLAALGHHVERWEQSPDKLAQVDAAHTTLIITEPTVNYDQKTAVADALKHFMERGGRVLLTGTSYASLLPGGGAVGPGAIAPALCYTVPEGPGDLAAVGSVEMANQGGWSGEGAQFRVEQRCTGQAVVVRFPVGAGEAIWWSSSTPLSNSGLKTDTDLKLLLATLYGRGGADRTVLFDEYLHSEHGEYHPLAGLPLWWLFAQFAALFALLVFSFSRRRGPLRLPVALPRSSPVEFAASMGDLYEKAGATNAATDAARRRLLRVVEREAGVLKASIDAGPDAIAEALQVRLGGDWTRLAEHLKDAAVAHTAQLAPRSALKLVRALAEDERALRAKLHPQSAPMVMEGSQSPVPASAEKIDSLV